jgi:diguanylate cyclase (GGDEF)-like protein
LKLQTRILLFLVPLIVAPLFAVGWLAYTQLRDTAERQALEQISTLLAQVRTQAQSELDTAHANLGVVANFSLLERYMVTEDQGERYTLMQPSLLRLFADFQKTYPHYYEIRILLPDGYEDARSTVGAIANVTEEEGDSAFFKALKASDQPVFTTYFRNPDNDEYALLVARVINLRDARIDPILAKPELRGYLVFTIRLDTLANLAEATRFGSRGHLLFSDDTGRVLFHPDPALIGKRMKAEVFAALRKNADENGGDLSLRIPLEGDDMLVLGHRLAQHLYLFGMQPKRELSAAGQRLGNLVALVTLVTIMLTTGLLFVLFRRILVRPIEKLSMAAHEIGRGNLTATVEVDDGGEIGALANSFREMGRNLQKSSEQISYLAYHDSLTGLPNRSMFNEYLVDAIADAHRHQQLLALMFLDVDNFKQVNDSLGHQVGDELLKAIAALLASCLRESDTLAVTSSSMATDIVARMGGDEFTILLPDVRDPYAAGAVARRILGRLQQPVIVGGNTLYISASIGITMYPTDGVIAEELIKHADIAMYHAKEHGKNNYQYYSAEMNVIAYQRVTMENKLRRALANDEFFLQYQPIYDVATGTVVGVEALLRWQDPQAGLVPPDGFIPIAEESGLIVPIGEWVLREACRQNKAWQAAGLPRVFMSVNVSNVQVNRGGLVEMAARVLRDTGLDPRYLDLEITESSIMTAHEQAIRALNGLRALGIRISLDDFGTGYSSLSYLRRFPIDILKIDRSFVQEILDNTKGDAIITAIVAMGHSLNLRIIAEGIETEHQLQFLRAQGCDMAQGFLLSRPLSAVAVGDLLSVPRVGYG